jgi:hypothetical protein
MSRTPDLSVVYCGSTFLLRATSPTGQQWIVRHIPGNARWFGGVVAVEHRYIDAIIQGAIDDGLSTSGGRTVLRVSGNLGSRRFEPADSTSDVQIAILGPRRVLPIIP